MTSSVLIQVGYFVAWAAVHSLLASLRFKDWARRTLGAGVDRWYRLAYVAFATATSLPILLMAALLPDRTLYVVPPPWHWVMLGGQLAVLAGLVGALLQTGPSYLKSLKADHSPPPAARSTP